MPESYFFYCFVKLTTTSVGPMTNYMFICKYFLTLTYILLRFDRQKILRPFQTYMLYACHLAK